MNELKPELRSTIQVPVRLNGGFGRGFARLSGASAPSGNGSPGFAACARAPDASDAIPSTTKAALSAIFVVSLVICRPFQFAARAARMGQGVIGEDQFFDGGPPEGYPAISLSTVPSASFTEINRPPLLPSRSGCTEIVT